MKLEYFGAHGRALMIRMTLAYGNVQFEDVHLTMEEFGANKAAGKYSGGQVPVLFMDDGSQLT